MANETNKPQADGDMSNLSDDHSRTRRIREAEQALPPEPGDAADRAQQASLDPDQPEEVSGDQDIDTAGTEADVEGDGVKDRRDGKASGGR